LPRSKVGLRYQDPELLEACSRNRACGWPSIWPFRILWPDPAGRQPIISLLSGPMSCILGSECMGYVLF
jgi:hypothetical protein